MERSYENCSNFRCVEQYDDVDNNLKSPLPKQYSVAMAYIPYQNNTKTYDDMKALERGTLFPVLDKPFMGGAGR